LIITGTILAIIVLVALIWDWNWFRPLAERQASAALHRPVKIGHLSLRLWSTSHLVLDDVTVGDPADDPAKGDLARIGRIAADIETWPLLHRQVILPSLEIDHARGELHSYGHGESNYAFSVGTPGTPAGPVPQLRALILDDVDLHVVDPALAADFRLLGQTQPPSAGGERSIRVDAKGTYAGAPINGYAIGGSVLTLRDASRPYPVDIDLHNGANHVTLKGTVEDPVSFKGADVQLAFSGDDMSSLYPLIGIPIPATPPFDIKGSLDLAGPYIKFHHIEGRLGSSDIEGDLDVAPGQGRPFITGNLASRHVLLADLAGLIGNKPGGAHEAAATPAQRAAKAEQEATAPLLPTTPINLPKLRAVDAKIHYRGAHIDSTTTPLDDLEIGLVVDDGVLRLEPLKFGIGMGDIAADLSLDGRAGSDIKANADIHIQHVDLSRIMQDVKPFKGQGVIDGRGRIETTGNSIASFMANGDGSVQMTMQGGNLSALLDNLAGLELGRAVYHYVGGDPQTKVDCLAADLALDKGVMATKTFVLDTGEETLWLGGKLDFRDQNLDLELTSRAKHFDMLSVKAPLDITGPMRSPSVQPDKAALAERAGPAAALGVLLTPVAALLATIQFGDDQPVGCKALLDSAHNAEKARPVRRGAGRG
jgi:uncharacterized protein involved in outer membrane biogenesis